MNAPIKAVPEGYPAVAPYLIVEGAAQLIEFLKAVFGATESFRMLHPDGSIGHTEVRIRDSVIMLSEARAQWKAMPTMLHLYVEDVDAIYASALAAGATSVQEPKNQFYGDRSGGVRDMCGNLWFMASHVEDVSEAEIQRRFAAAAGAH